MVLVPLPQLPLHVAQLHDTQQFAVFSALLRSLSTPTALHMASRSCLVKAFFLDASVVADYARCIGMLLTHAVHIRHHRRGNVLERCLAVVENLLHSLAVRVMETRCTFFPAHAPPGVHENPEGLQGDESSEAYLAAELFTTFIMLTFAHLVLVPCHLCMASLPRWVLWVLWVSSALVFMSMRSVRETLLVLVLLAIICVVSRGLM